MEIEQPIQGHWEHTQLSGGKTVTTESPHIPKEEKCVKYLCLFCDCECNKTKNIQYNLYLRMVGNSMFEVLETPRKHRAK